MMKNRLLILFLPLLLSVVPAAAKGLSAEKRKEEDKESVFHHFLRTNSNMPSMVNRAL